MPNEPIIATETKPKSVAARWILRGLALIVLAFAALEVRSEAASEGILIASGTVWENAESTTDGYLDLSADELVDLVSPIALYPDDLLAIVLPAATYPLEIVQAARFLEKLQKGGDQTPDEDWDESVVALINYPEVVTLLSEDLDWTWQLGQAVLNQQTDVLAAVEHFRGQAYAAGNLLSDEYKVVEVIDDSIEIGTADPEIIYVPYYEPEEVVEYQNSPVYHYYDRPYPVYYYPYPAGYNFYSGRFWGVTSAYSIGWRRNNLHLHHLSYYDHPYHGFHYYNHNYRRPTVAHNYNYYSRYAGRYSSRHHAANIWQPARHRVGARPTRHHRRYKNRDDYRHRDYRGAHSLNRSRDHARFNRRHDRQQDSNPADRLRPRSRSRSLPADSRQQAPQMALRSDANDARQTEPRTQRRTALTGQRSAALVSLQQRSQRGNQDHRQRRGQSNTQGRPQDRQQNNERRRQQTAQRDQRRTRTQRQERSQPPREQRRSPIARQERSRQQTVPRAQERPRRQRQERPQEQIAQRAQQRRPVTQREQRSPQQPRQQRQASAQRPQSQPRQQRTAERRARSQVAQTHRATIQRRGRVARHRR